jgi:hypothetical protein
MSTMIPECDTTHRTRTNVRPTTTTTSTKSVFCPDCGDTAEWCTTFAAVAVTS